jgi:ABC-type nitrate/sulfonate/bicarbonate transport system permease component
MQSLISSFLGDPIIAAQGGGEHGYLPHIVATIVNFLSGFIPGATGGFLLALAMAQYPRMLFVIEPILEFIRALPPLLVIPFALLFFQSGDALIAVTVGAYSAFSVCVYTLNALRNIPSNYLWLSKLMSAGQAFSMLTVQIPAIVPELVGGIRVTTVLGLGIAVVVEYMAAPSGIGRVMKFAVSYARVDLIMVGVVWIVLIAFVFDSLAQLAFAFTLRWTKRNQMLRLV